MITDYDIMRALVAQVERAIAQAGPHARTLTVISRPMWRAWCRALGEPEYGEPGPKDLLYGSPVCVIEDPRLFSFTKINAQYKTQPPLRPLNPHYHP